MILPTAEELAELLKKVRGRPLPPRCGELEDASGTSCVVQGDHTVHHAYKDGESHYWLSGADDLVTRYYQENAARGVARQLEEAEMILTAIRAMQ